MALHALLDHGPQEIGDSAESKRRGLIPCNIGLFRSVESDLDLVSALGGVQAPLVFIEPVAVIYVGSSPTAAADVRVLAIAAFALELGVAEGIEHIRAFPQIDKTRLANISADSGM